MALSDWAEALSGGKIGVPLEVSSGGQHAILCIYPLYGAGNDGFQACRRPYWKLVPVSYIASSAAVGTLALIMLCVTLWRLHRFISSSPVSLVGLSLCGWVGFGLRLRWLGWDWSGCVGWVERI